MHLILKNNPILKLLIPFIVGIIIALHLPYSLPTFIRIAFLILLVSIIGISFIKPSTTKNNILNISLIVLFFTLGMARATKEDKNIKAYDHPIIMLAQLTDYPDSTSKSIKAQVHIEQVYTDSAWKKVTTGATIYLQKSKKARRLEAGDYIYTYAQPELLTNQGNPGEFDFKKWANSNGIYYQFYTKEENWSTLPNRGELSLNIHLKKFRRSIFQYYKRSGISDDELAVFSALTLGDKSMLEHDLRQGYAAAGLMHILAVSGLHVGLIYAIILLLFKPFIKSKWGKIFRFIISIIVLWSYAMLTGLSPSVTRAATMFSVFVTGDLFGKKYAVYNSMALAAFILLFQNPEIIENVGFQLSFLAVFGIVALYPYIYRWIYIKWKWPDKIWQLIAVSIAAQIITTPLSLYYFNQFPLLFLVSNILMIPLATLLMYLFVAFLLVAPFPELAYYFAKIIDTGTYVMNQFTGWINSIDWAILKGLYINEYQIITIYIIIAAIVFWGLKTNYKNLRIVGWLVILFLSTLLYDKINTSNKNSLIVYNTYHEPLMMFTAGSTYTIYNPLEIDNVEWYTQTTTTRNRLNKSSESPIIAKDQFCVFGNKTNKGIFYNIDVVPKQDSINCRWLVVSDKSPYDLNKLLKFVKAQVIIADASVSSYKLKRWKEQTQSLNIEILDVKKNGAYVEEWND